MLDYKGIEALFTVQELQSFEGAAKKLHITQSAVSQRIKGLEAHYREPLLIRTLPYRPTQLGQHLIGHFKRICLLEDAVKKQMGIAVSKPRISVALNRDSLETWFLDLTKRMEIFNHITLEIIADDQERTLEYFKNGSVTACLSTSGKEVPGGQISFLGNMEYFLVASPEFSKKYFSRGDLRASLLTAPAIQFDQNDRLHERYLEKNFNLNGKEIDFHIVPSVQGFKKFALLGYGYALIPKIDILEELRQEQLIKLSENIWTIPLYWHSWALESEIYQQFNRDIVHHGTLCLRE